MNRGNPKNVRREVGYFRARCGCVSVRWAGFWRGLCGGVVLLAAGGKLVLGASSEPAARDDLRDRSSVYVVAGAPGEADFASDITVQIEAWRKVCAQAGARSVVIGEVTSALASDHDLLRDALAAELKTGLTELWIILIGHGTFDGKEAKLNLRGPDLTATELASWLKSFSRPLAIIDTTSASAPFLNRLAAPGRVIVSATRSGNEQNYARFGKYLAEALPDPKSDLDKDGQISLLESFLSAAHRTEEFYKTEGRLATEHALLDDNGDGLGTPADWFRGVIAIKRSKDGAALDGVRAHQFHLVRSAAEQQLSPERRGQRDRLEQLIAALREKKEKLSEEKYFGALEKLLLELAAVYRQS